VFPVISLKALSLIRHHDKPAHARMEGLAFLLGVLESPTHRGTTGTRQQQHGAQCNHGNYHAEQKRQPFWAALFST
jgi:thiol:disulfide interchange protein